MVLRPGEEAKLTPEQEKELLEQLRAEREAKAHVKLQADAQSLAMTLGALELNEVPAKAKELASDKKKFGGESKAAAMAIMFNTIVRNGVPLKEDDAAATPRGGKKGGGGGKKGQNAVKASAAKVVDRQPCTAAEARKAIKANKHTLKEIATGPEAQLSLLKAAESWLLSAHGSAALPGAAKVIEVLYDLDLATEDVLLKYWDTVQAQATTAAARLEAAKVKTAELEASHELSLAAVQKAEAEQADLAHYKKNSEQYAQNVRCGNNPNKEEEAIEKAAIAQLKKAIELHTQSQKVLAARHKTLVADKAELESEQRSLAEISKAVEHQTPYVTHAKPFFDWLAASDEEDEDEDEEPAKGAKTEKAVEVS